MGISTTLNDNNNTTFVEGQNYVVFTLRARHR